MMDYNAEFLNKVDLRLLYPHLYGNPIHVLCHINPAHQDTGKANLAINTNFVYCFRCREHMGALDYLLLCSQQEPERFGGTFATTSDARLWAEHHICHAEAVVAGAAGPQDVPALDTRQIKTNRDCLVRQPGRQQYLEQHYGLSLRTQERAYLGHTGVAFAIPVVDAGGDWCNIRFRVDPARIPQSAVRYWSLPGRGQATWYLPPPLRLEMQPIPSFAELQQRMERKHPGQGDWILCEGEFKALLAWQMRFLALSITDGAPAVVGKHKHMLADLAGCRVGVAYDQDEAGLEYGSQVVKLLNVAGATAYLVEWNGKKFGKDFNELAANGHGDKIVRILRAYAA